jgi:hypothetical protein
VTHARGKKNDVRRSCNIVISIAQMSCSSPLSGRETLLFLLPSLTHAHVIQPAEKLGDGDSFFYSRDGGFAYKRTDETADYYPVVHAHSQLLIAEYVREMDTLQKLTKQDLSEVVDGEAFNEEEAKKLAETKGIPVGVLTEPMVKLMRLQCDLPDAIRKSYVAEKCTVREYLSNACHYTMQDEHAFDAHGESDAVWTVFKM